LLFPFLFLLSAFVSVTVTNTIQAENGKGTDIFRVILTIFEVDKSKGDVVVVVTTNNGEASKVKFLDIDAVQSNPNTGSGGGIIEYVATFPNVTVNAGEEYRACVLPVKTLEPICTTGNNSPAARPEFIDISLNATSEVDQDVQQEGNSEEESEED
jgi:hypothetical protein